MTWVGREIRDRKVIDDHPLKGLGQGRAVLVSQGLGSDWGGTGARSYKPSESPRGAME